MTAHPASKPIDKYIPWMIVAFFLVVAAVDAVFVTLAVRTHTGVVTEQAYEKGLDYNKAIEASAAQSAMGWTGEIAFKADTLSFDLKDKDGNGIEGAVVEASIRRPVTKGYDRDIALADKGLGLYQAPLSLPLKGQWEVRVYASANGQDFQSDLVFSVP